MKVTVVLKGIGYLIVALTVLTVLSVGFLGIVTISIIGGLVLSLIGTWVMTAGAIREYFENPKKRSDAE